MGNIYVEINMQGKQRIYRLICLPIL